MADIRTVAPLALETVESRLLTVAENTQRSNSKQLALERLIKGGISARLSGAAMDALRAAASPELGQGDFYINVARGIVPGMKFVNKFGRNPVIDTTSDPEDIWDGGGVWVAPTTARIHDLASSSLNDDAGGTGATHVIVEGLDSDGLEQEEVVALAGTSNAATTKSYIIIQRMYVIAAGSGGQNAGNITATAQTDATVTAQISTGQNQTLMAIYQVPSNYDAFIVDGFVSVNSTGGAGARADVRLMAKPFGQVFQTKTFLGITEAGTSAYNRDWHTSPAMVPAMTTLKGQVFEVAQNSTDVSAGFDLLLVKRG